MAFTYQNVVDQARLPLNDEDKARYSDATLLSFANQGMLQIIKRRPDLFMGQYASMPDGFAVLTDTFPIPAEYLQNVADYVTARAETIDDEHVNTGRAGLFMQLFGGES